MESMLAPAHILSYGTLLGTTVFETFVASIISFKKLERPTFAMLQNHMFPVYFGMQSALPVVIALTYPGLRTVVHNVSPGIAGVLDETVRKNTLVPLATIFVTGVANLFCLMPKAKAIKAQRLQLEAVEGKSQYEPPVSPAMDKLNKSFRRVHGFSTAFNLISLIATVAYGVTLSRRIQ
ncbi:hypothetical protein AAP_01034 [Ascosphaera apis ARSEF 7405]|uniref:TMEM205-like domain-containing protein n=1 Tax=Ascosphaera apis ARSEF 7405 TaxID=392613 RepID=A0A168C7Y1_9EURO|nr:hypothetical protein AAP_01034 [Ascosphaera apis ARSEF 7405]